MCGDDERAASVDPGTQAIHEKLQTGWHLPKCSRKDRGPTESEVRLFNRGGDGPTKGRILVEENPGSGETVVLAGKTFTFVSKVLHDNEILIGADVEATVQNAHDVDPLLGVLVAELASILHLEEDDDDEKETED